MFYSRGRFSHLQQRLDVLSHQLNTFLVKPYIDHLRLMFSFSVVVEVEWSATPGHSTGYSFVNLYVYDDTQCVQYLIYDCIHPSIPFLYLLGVTSTHLLRKRKHQVSFSDDELTCIHRMYTIWVSVFVPRFIGARRPRWYSILHRCVKHSMFHGMYVLVIWV